MARQTGIVQVRFRLPATDDAKKHSRLAITRASLQAISGIQRDTARGIDMRGRRFVAYDPDYAEARRESGRNASPPDLTLTGTMLRALRLLRVDSPKRAVIGWEGQHATRDVLAGYGANRFLQLDQGRVSRLDSRPLRRGEAAFIRRASTQARQQIRVVPYFKLVMGLQRRRPFFGVVRRERVRQVREVYTRTLRDGLADDLNSRGAR